VLYLLSWGIWVVLRLHIEMLAKADGHVWLSL
jgi:hypothetical protein